MKKKLLLCVYYYKKTQIKQILSLMYVFYESPLTGYLAGDCLLIRLFSRMFVPQKILLGQYFRLHIN